MTTDQLKDILNASRDELDQFGVASLRLFGSIARNGGTDESDVDLLVEFNRPTGLFGLIALKHWLEELLGRPVDINTADSLRPALRQRVFRDAVQVA